MEKLSVLSTPQWEREIWSFIMEWFSAADSIEVKTSGSTGKPKSIPILKEHMAASAKATIQFLGLKPGDIALLCLPVKYIAAKMMIVRALVGGLDLHFVEPSSAPYLEKLDRIDFAAMVPLQVKAVLERQGAGQLEKIGNLIIGGGFVPIGLEKQLKDLKSNIWQTYGMTETVTHIAMRRINGPQASAFYTPLPGVNVSLDERDCLVIDAEQIGVAGLETNDVCELESEGMFRVLGRIDNVVNSGGVKLIPEVIEQKLQGFIEKEFYVAGLPDDTLGERLVIYIQGGQEMNREAFFLWEEMEKRLTGYEIPKEIIFKEGFEKTVSGKIIRG
jgi:O-succinylbenzoic acid--CoA ligase